MFPHPVQAAQPSPLLGEADHQAMEASTASSKVVGHVYLARLHHLSQTLLPQANANGVPLAEALMATVEFLNDGIEQGFDLAFARAKARGGKQELVFGDDSCAIPELVKRAMDRGAALRFVVGMPEEQQGRPSLLTRGFDDLPRSRRQWSDTPKDLPPREIPRFNQTFLRAGIDALPVGKCMLLAPPKQKMLVLGRTGPGEWDQLVVGHRPLGARPELRLVRGYEAAHCVDSALSFQEGGARWAMVLPSSE
ncbi:hypothetical protein [Roseateles amylovorans]|uniref:Uncharacterized protein n=1 Tax=Roseateles amylovorans TaxID=2978473 RepID=A0ABY6AXZ6_9BURK|nr:hypothetical protein [Roseateles amylovorans]UXH78061.1 hypothetical protein N4261_24415 [Roseateles amylovorans]